MSTINKPLPHRPFSVAVAQEKAPRRQRQPQMTPVSTPRPRPYVPANDKSTVPPVPVSKRAHLVTRSPSPPYSTHTRAASDALPSSRSKPSHSFSESQVRSNPHSSTSDLVPPHLKPARTSSFWRRHWFVILVCILAVSSISAAVTVVLRSRSAGVYIPPEITPNSEAPIGTASLGSATRSIATSSTSATESAPGGPPPSPAPTRPS